MMKWQAPWHRILVEGGFTSQNEFKFMYHYTGVATWKLQPKQEFMQLIKCEQEVLPSRGPRRELLILFHQPFTARDIMDKWAFEVPLERRPGIHGMWVTWPPSLSTPRLSPFTAPLKGIRNNNLPCPRRSGKHWGVIYSAQGKGDLSVLGTSVYEYS